MEALVDDAIASDRFVASLLSAFAALVLLLAVVGQAMGLLGVGIVVAGASAATHPAGRAARVDPVRVLNAEQGRLAHVGETLTSCLRAPDPFPQRQP